MTDLINACAHNQPKDARKNLFCTWCLLLVALVATSSWLLEAAVAFPTGGVVHTQLMGAVNQSFLFSLYAGARISLALECASAQDSHIVTEWVIRQTPCLETRLWEDKDGQSTPDIGRAWSQLYENPGNFDPDDLGDASIWFRRNNGPLTIPCHTVPYIFSNDMLTRWTECYYNATLAESHCQVHNSSAVEVTKHKATSLTSEQPALLQAPRDGIYLIMLRILDKHGHAVDAGTSAANGLDADSHASAVAVNITVIARHDYGYLAAVDYPLLQFYGIMSFVYAVLGFIWLALCAHQWRDLIRIQLWIGMVIFIGMMEKALFYMEFETVNSTGQPTVGFAIVVAELMSAFKKSLSRMLIIIVAIGFGITRPRLGQDFGRVLLVGILYFVFSAVEGAVRLIHTRDRPLGAVALAALPLTLLDTVIWYWVFTALLSTIRALRARRNAVKLRLFVSFMNTLAVAVVVAVAFQVWSTWVHHRLHCIMQWKTLWLDEAFWHILFSAVLLVIMVLWRPTENSQRFAFTMMLEEDVIDDAEAETVFLQELHSSSVGLLTPGDVRNGDVIFKSSNSNAKSGNTKPPGYNNNSGDKVSSKKHDFTWTDERLPQSITEAIMSECGAGSDDDEVELMTSSRRHRDAQAKME